MSDQDQRDRPDGFALQAKPIRPQNNRIPVTPFEQMQHEARAAMANARWNVRGGGGWCE